MIVTSVSVLHANYYEFIQLRFLGLTDFEISFFDTVLYLSYLIIGIIIGILSDRWGKRKVFIILGSGGSIIFFWLMPLTLIYPVLLVFRFCQGAFTVMAWQVVMTLILDLSTTKNRGRNMGLFGIFLVAAMGLGPVLGGFLARIGVFFPYYFAMILSGIVFILSLVLLKEPSEIKKQQPTLKQSFSIINRHPKLIIPGVFNFVDRFHMGFIIFITPFFLQNVLGLGPELRGMVLGIYALPVMFLQYPMGKLSDRIGRYKPLLVGSLAYGIILSIIGYLGSFHFVILIALFICLGVFAGFTTPPAMALVGDFVKREDNAMAMGFFNFLGNLGIIIGPLIAGLVATLSNYAMAFFIAGIIELISLGCCGLLILYFRHDQKKEKTLPS